MDTWVALYAAVAVVALCIIAIMLLVKRNYQPLRVRNVPLLTIMCIGGSVHIMAAVVANRHFAFLTRLESSACVFWGYWLPYGVGVTTWFSAFYLRLWMYTSALSMWCTRDGAKRARTHWKYIVAVVCSPIWAILIVGTAKHLSVADASTGLCESALGLKVSVAIWISVCTLVLIASVISFRIGLAGDLLQEFPPIALIATMGVVVVTATAVVFIGDWVDYVWARSCVTFSVATLYLWSFGVVAGKPLFRALQGNRGYAALVSSSMHGGATLPVDSMRSISTNAPAIFGDFMVYCEEIAISFHRAGDTTTSTTTHVTGAFREFVAWQAQWPAGRPDRCDVQALADAGRTLCGKYLQTESEFYIGAPSALGVAAVTAVTNEKEAFRAAKEWIVDELHRVFGHTYLTEAIQSRSLWSDVSVRMTIQTVRRGAVDDRLADAGLGMDEVAIDDSSSTSSGDDDGSSMGSELDELES